MRGKSHEIVLVFVSVLVISIDSEYYRSSCPDYFRYLTDEITGEITGRITIPNAPKKVPLNVRVSLSVDAALPTKYVGKLELATSRSEAVKAVNEGKPIIYRLHFPLRNPLPVLTELIFNEKRYCMGKRATGPVVTTIFLEHTLYPPRILALIDNNRPSSNNDNYSNVPGTTLHGHEYSPLPISPPTSDPSHSIFAPINKDNTFMDVERPISGTKPNFHPSPSTLYPQESVTSRPDTLTQNEIICGIANPSGVNHLIANGESTLPGQWPWLTAIFLAKMKYEFRCAGSLITDRHVITAAHCKFDNDLDVPDSVFLVSLGRYNLHDWREPGSRIHEVMTFHLHPEYRNRFSADADLAIILLRRKVEFSNRIRPLCLWSRPIALENVVGRTGYIVGWGKDETGDQHLQEPRMASAPIVSQEDCLRSNLAFLSSTSNRTFCAGSRDGIGPCNGDSGAGLVILDNNTGRHNLRGIVSLSLSDERRKSCDLTQYVVYVDTAKYLDWIRSETNLT